jgi:hypothetical protein
VVLCTILIKKEHIFISIDQYTTGISWHAVKIPALGAKEFEKAHAEIDEPRDQDEVPGWWLEY